MLKLNFYQIEFSNLHASTICFIQHPYMLARSIKQISLVIKLLQVSMRNIHHCPCFIYSFYSFINGKLQQQKL